MDIAAEIVECERRRIAATVDGDGPALEKLYAADLTYVHTTARVDTKRSLIDSMVGRSSPGRPRG